MTLTGTSFAHHSMGSVVVDPETHDMDVDGLFAAAK
jgi:hypothetical protein